VPPEFKGRDVDLKGEASLRGHLKNGVDDKTGSQALPIPQDPSKDAQLTAALDILHGVKKAANTPAPAKEPEKAAN
jgi:carboxyl-terminal processing protease